MPINVLIADDHTIVREGVKCILESTSDVEVIAEASDGYECLNAINKTNPNVVLLDISMPNLDGLKVLQIMRDQKMSAKVLIMTAKEEPEYLLKAVDMGCDGYILKKADSASLRKAIHSVYNGEMYIEPELKSVLDEKVSIRDTAVDKLNDLTRREIDVLKLLAEGLFNKEIASRLNISERTVKNHVSNIFKKISVSDRTQAAVFAIKNNLIKITY